MTDSERMMYATAEPEATLPDLLDCALYCCGQVTIPGEATDEQTLVIGAYLISSTSWAPSSALR